MLKKAVKLAGIGFLTGIFIGYAISIMTALDDPDVFVPVSERLVAVVGGNIPMAYVMQGLLSGVYGAICFGAIVFYDIERWPLALATGAHCAAIVLIYIPLGFFLGWLSNIIETLIVAGIQIVVFFIIWLILYLNYKKQVKELNEMQEHYQQSKK